MRRSRTRFAPPAAAVLAVAALAVGCGDEPVAVDGPRPTGAAARECRALLSSLPDEVAGREAREVRPGDAAAAAWGDPPVVLRCGVPRPAALRPTSVCFEVNDVGWLATQNGRALRGDRPVEGTVTFTTIGRAAYVELRVPDDGERSSVAPLTELAAPIREAVPERTPCQ